MLVDGLNLTDDLECHHFMMTAQWGKVWISLFRPLSLWLLWGVWEPAVQVVNWLYWKRLIHDADDEWWIMMFWWFFVAKNDLLICSHLRWYIKGKHWGSAFDRGSILLIHHSGNPNTTSGAAAWLVDCWPWVACQVDDDCPVGITCNLVWGPSLEQNHLVVPFRVVNDWMMLDFFWEMNDLRFVEQTWEKRERRNFNFKFGSSLL